jgi:ubiquinone/menaquinone biosynthesis C-methylase UbiE
MSEVDRQREVWEDFHGARFGNFFPETPIVKFVHRTFKDPHSRQGQQLVDLGCGSGNNVVFCARLGLQVYGIDFSHSAIKKTKDRLAESGLDARLYVRDMSDLPLDDSSVDAVIDSTSIQHVPEAEIPKVFEEIFRVLKPHGRFGETQFQTHLFSKSELQSALRRFSSVQFDHLEFSDCGGKHITKYWLVEAVR